MSELERQRIEADRVYNDALTAVDLAIMRPAALTAPIVVPDAPPPMPPPGWRNAVLRRVQEWLAPVFARQCAFNARVAEELNGNAEREHRAWQEFEKFEHALVIFLQQITAFVESKDRELAASTSARFETQEQRIPDISAQLAVLQRAVQMLKRELVTGPQSSVPSLQLPVAGPQRDDYKYVAFEDQFRGSDEEVREKFAAYVPLFAGASDVLDIGCGRGEFLTLLKTAGVSGRGVDTNAEMVATARERGLDATHTDGLGYLASLADESLGGLMAAQVVEHLAPSYLMQLLDLAHAKLRPGAPIVIETINPTCWLAFFTSYIRDFTHSQPIHPETLQYLLRASGFTRVTLRYSAPVPDNEKLQLIALPPNALASSGSSANTIAELTNIINTNTALLNRHLFTNVDYAAIGYRG